MMLLALNFLITRVGAVVKGSWNGLQSAAFRSGKIWLYCLERLLEFRVDPIPIRLFAAPRTEHVSFHMIHGVCNTRLKQQLCVRTSNGWRAQRS